MAFLVGTETSRSTVYKGEFFQNLRHGLGNKQPAEL
jgi:hypothetical protein